MGQSITQSMDIWMDGWINLYRDVLMVELTNIWLCRWIDGWVDEWMNQLMDVCSSLETVQLIEWEWSIDVLSGRVF